MMDKALTGDHTLCDLALECQKCFREIKQLKHDEAIAARLENLLCQPNKYIPILTLRDLEDDHEQFRVWAKNLGVFATDQGSLDFRLREASDAKEGIVLLSVSLKSELTAVETLLRHDRASTEDDERSSVGESSSSDGSSEYDTEGHSPQQLAALELQARLKRVADIVNKLMRLAEVIRASGASHRNIRASRYVHFEDGVNMTAQFEEQYLPSVLRHKFKLESPLLERFTKAISLRRRRFMYQATHQKRLAYGNESEERRKKPKQSPRVYSADAETPVAEEFTPVHKVATSRITSMVPTPGNRSVLQPPTLATTFDYHPQNQKVQSTAISGSNGSATSGNKIPPAPRIPDRATHFQCPYCCILVPRRKLLGRNWREHVITDLQPFVCLEPECLTPDQTFESQQNWIEHQKWEHSMEWWCAGDETRHSPMRFLSHDAYVTHLQQSRDCLGLYKPLNGTNTYKETAGRPSLSPFSCCPLCDFLPDNMTTLALDSTEDRVSMATICQKQLQKHIADEMLAIFIIALPNRTDIDDALTNTESNESIDTRSTILALSDVSLDFMRLETPGIHHPDRSLDNSEIGKYANFVSITEDFQLEDWEKVWTSPQLQESVRKTYGGAEEDEVLQKLASSVQLKQSLMPLGPRPEQGYPTFYDRFEDDKKEQIRVPPLGEMVIRDVLNKGEALHLRLMKDYDLIVTTK